MIWDGTTQVAGIIGFPVSHSLSPLMHNAAAGALGLNFAYLPFSVAPHQLPKAVAGVRALNLLGVNITIPYKEQVLPLLDGLDKAAQQIGAVNTIVVQDGLLIGHNTDWSGFRADLQEKGVQIAGTHAIVLGAGGSARAIVFALLQGGAEQITVVARRLHQAEQLARGMAEVGIGQVICRQFSEMATLPPSALLINTTPLGMTPYNQQTPWPSDLPFPGQPFVYDLVYRPAQTSLLTQAQQAQLPFANGLGLLLHQGAQAFQKWTGQTPNLTVMSQAIQSAL